MKKILVIVLLFSTMLIVFGCSGASAPEVVTNVVPIDYGNNVYFFERKSDFGSYLSAFLAKHPELELVSTASLNDGGHGVTSGYWVIMRSK